ncbi:hypothetical protein BN946_scf184603.g10 [Trametes cinnabarina]|uniref:Uncharacterized protein n=1 Tax=Pycnoporus cinnabarinus TaxID=5643 RepID=A0A060SDI1_PYCCI|nr:hypothetical protein BN946_scf184603.g10 [Trametes cinnabarina]
MKSCSTLLASLALLAATTSGVFATAAAALGSIACADEVVAETAYIGAKQDVKVAFSHCGIVPLVTADGKDVSSLQKRQGGTTNVCGASCNMFCFTPSGGGPNEDDCTIIADALIYDSQNVGVLFNITASGTPTDKITMQYASCTTYFLNQHSTVLTYCRTVWSTLVNWLASDCDVAQNAHGGLCVADDQSWYIQVQHT